MKLIQKIQIHKKLAKLKHLKNQKKHNLHAIATQCQYKTQNQINVSSQKLNFKKFTITSVF